MHTPDCLVPCCKAMPSLTLVPVPPLLSPLSPWGLRLYQHGTDTGITFTIKLLKESLYQDLPLLWVLKPPWEEDIDLTPCKKPRPVKRSLHHYFPNFLPQPPHDQVNSKDLVLALINQTYLTLNITNPNLTTECWLCYHSPPLL